MVECLLDDMSLAYADDPGCIERANDIFEILAWTIYEKLRVVAEEEWGEVQESLQKECSNCRCSYDLYNNEWNEIKGMCESCAEEEENARECSECGGNFSVDDVYWNEYEGMCETCIDNIREQEEEED